MARAFKNDIVCNIKMDYETLVLDLQADTRAGL